MTKRKAGLHRKVSSIFDGIPVPGSKSSRPIDEENTSVKEAESGDASSALAPGGSPPIADRPPREDKPAQRQGSRRTPERPWAPKKQKEHRRSAPIAGVSDRRQKIKLMSVAALLIVLVFVMMPLFKPDTGGTTTKTEENTSKPEESVASISQGDSEVRVDWETPKPYPVKIRDPMRTNRIKDPVTGKWVEEYIVEGVEEIENIAGVQTIVEEDIGVRIIVRGILYSDDRSSVVIGNDILYEGDMIFGAKIVKINKDTVEFEKKDREFSKRIQR